MSEKWQDRPNPRIDVDTRRHYRFGSDALIRREHMELTEFDEDRDFNGKVLRAANIYPGAIVLDMGCGEGTDMFKLVNPRDLDHQGTVIGLEIPSEEADDETVEIPFADRFFILENSIKSLGRPFHIFDRTHPIHDLSVLEPGAVGVMEGHAQKIHLPDSSVDFVLAANVLQHVPVEDQTAALSEIYRVLRPGGTLAAITNAAGNKRKFHEALRNMGVFLDSKAPGPLSARFDFEQAQELIPAHFVNPVVIPFNRRQKITSDRVGLVNMAADTYRSLFEPYPHEDWDDAKWRFLEGPIWEEITRSPDRAWYDELHRGAVLAQKPLK